MRCAMVWCDSSRAYTHAFRAQVKYWGTHWPSCERPSIHCSTCASQCCVFFFLMTGLTAIVVVHCHSIHRSFTHKDKSHTPQYRDAVAQVRATLPPTPAVAGTNGHPLRVQVSSFTDAALKYGRDRYLHGATGGGNGDGSGGGGSSDHTGLHVLESITNAAAPLHSAAQAGASGCPVFREPKLSPLPGCPHRVCVCALRSVCI